mmetsp:Transcript_32340/g.80099  ORF Transcript_32340/g.80099 Transcript_32340/m.80099 type:complete len:260 (+) Transcript_32340:804-1583(+)
MRRPCLLGSRLLLLQQQQTAAQQTRPPHRESQCRAGAGDGGAAAPSSVPSDPDRQRDGGQPHPCLYPPRPSPGSRRHRVAPLRLVLLEAGAGAAEGACSSASGRATGQPAPEPPKVRSLSNSPGGRKPTGARAHAHARWWRSSPGSGRSHQTQYRYRGETARRCRRSCRVGRGARRPRAARGRGWRGSRRRACCSWTASCSHPLLPWGPLARASSGWSRGHGSRVPAPGLHGGQCRCAPRGRWEPIGRSDATRQHDTSS